MELFRWYSDPEGFGVFLPNESAEVLDAIDTLERNKFVICEYERDKLYKLRQIYEDALLAGPIHKTLARITNMVSYGHIDYCGMLDTPNTRTKETIKQLMARSSENSCFAFTHCDFERGIIPHEGIEADIRNNWGDRVASLTYRDAPYSLLVECTWAAAFSGAEVSPLYFRRYRSNKLSMVTSAFAVDCTKVFNKELFFEQFLALTKENNK